MQRIIYKNQDDTIAILIPTQEAIEEYGIEAIAQKDTPAGLPYWIVDTDVIPTDRTFRDAWEKSGSEVIHNMDKAKSIAHDKRRSKRAADFAPLDIQATIPAKAQDAEAARQIIRNANAELQINIDKTTSIEELKAIIVAEGL